MLDMQEIDRRYGFLWQFATPRYTVAFWAEEEDMDPADSFEFEDDIEAVRSGAVDWFCAFVGVFDNQTGECIGYDCLGGCAYTTARSFAEGANRSGYFRDMVNQAVREARAHLLKLQFVAA